MADFVLPGFQYVLPLDSLDMVYLSRHIENPVQEKRLLWKKSDLNGESTFCQVKIVSKLQESPDMYTCHICNIIVPKAYIKQHYNSKKHTTLDKLTKIIIENHSKQNDILIYEDDITPDESDTFYCDVCAEAIRVEYKLTHNKTSKHSQSKKNAKLAADFLKMYVESRPDETDNQKALENIQSEAESESEFEFESDEDSYSDFDSDPEYYNDAVYNIARRTKSKSKKCEERIKISNNAKHCSPEEIKDFEMYLQQVLVKFYMHNNLDCNLMVSEDSIEVITAKGRRNKITVDMFHSYKRVDKAVFCQICQLWVNQETKAHSVSDQHVRLVTQPIDENFARRIDRDWSHCLVCNERIYPDSDHAEYNSYHRSQLNTSTRFGVQIENDDVNKQTFCYICRIDIPKSTILLHINSKEHKDRWKNNFVNNSQCTSCIQNSKIEIKKKSSNNGRPILKLEPALAPNSNSETDDLKLEFLNSKHQNYNRNKVTFTKSSVDGNFYSYCKQFSFVDNTLVLCNVCNKNIPNNTHDVTFHVKNKVHCDTVANLLKNNRIIIAYESPLYYCKYCDELTPSFVEHIGQPNHIDLVKINEIIDINKLWLATCEGPKDISYKEMFNDLLKNNHVHPKGDVFYCDKCQLAMMKIETPTHIISKQHTDNMKCK